jgi:CBS domain containing-hemolysin-like protein
MPSIPVSAIALAFLTHDWSACLIRNPEGVNGIVTLHDLLKALLPPLPDTDA